MMRNYTLLFFRFIKKTRIHFAINILGLSVGLSCVFLLSHYVKRELEFDRFHKNADRIYRLTFDVKFGEVANPEEATTPPPLGKELENSFPEVEASVRLFDPNLFDPAVVVRSGDKIFKENNVLYVDSNFFYVFTFPLIAGSPEKVLVHPNSVVLTSSSARKYFSGEDAVGKSIMINDKLCTVTGICADAPATSHFPFDFLVSMTSFRMHDNVNWMNSPLYTYVVLGEQADPAALESKLTAFARLHAGADLEKYSNVTYDNLIRNGGRFTFHLQRLTDVHLHSHLASELSNNGDIRSVQILSLVAIFVLIIASFNFINLTTAMAGLRAKEVGVKKILGGTRYHLMTQFLIESVLFCLLALAISALMVYAAIPLFNSVIKVPLRFVDLISIGDVLQWIIFAFGLGILAGLYPALKISGFRSDVVLRGRLQSGLKSTSFRNVLVTVQFCISIMLVACSLVFFDQMKFLSTFNLGFDKEKIIIIDNVSKVASLQGFKNDLLRLPGVSSASVSTAVPASELQVLLSQPEGIDHSINFVYFFADYDFAKTLGLTVVQGRDFSRDFSSDTTIGAFLINESLAKLFPVDPIGKKINFGRDMPIVGVVKDFNLESLRKKAQPAAICLRGKGDFLSLSLNSSNFHAVLASIEEVWKKQTDVPFEFSFLDQQIESQYSNEKSLRRLTVAFSAISILISCLGLAGLITFVIRAREKEICIRKVLGSTVVSIQLIFTKEIIKLVAISAVVAVPLSAWLAEQWLQGFAYRTALNPAVFIYAVAALGLVAVTSASYLILRVSFINPVVHLRNE